MPQIETERTRARTSLRPRLGHRGLGDVEDVRLPHDQGLHHLRQRCRSLLRGVRLGLSIIEGTWRRACESRHPTGFTHPLVIQTLDNRCTITMIERSSTRELSMTDTPSRATPRLRMSAPRGTRAPTRCSPHCGCPAGKGVLAGSPPLHRHAAVRVAPAVPGDDVPHPQRAARRRGRAVGAAQRGEPAVHGRERERHRAQRRARGRARAHDDRRRRPLVRRWQRPRAPRGPGAHRGRRQQAPALHPPRRAARRARATSAWTRCPRTSRWTPTSSRPWPRTRA